MDLTDKQLMIWKELGSELSAPPDLCQRALSFYSHYRLHQSWVPDKALLVFRVAYFLSEKSQVIFDSEGRQLHGIALSANSILRDHHRHQQFLYHIKQMIRTVPIPVEAKHLEEQVGLFSRQLSFALAFLGKLRSTLKRVHVSQKIQASPQYQQQVLRCLWLLFVDCRAEKQANTDIVQSTCLLSCVFAYFLTEKYREDGIFSIYFENQGEGCTLSNEEEDLLQFTQNYFHIKDTNIYKKVRGGFNRYKENLIHSIDMRCPFAPSSIQKNTYILQKLYNKKLTDDRLDQSTFLKGSATTSNIPARVTPFGRRPLLAPRNAPALSHRMLTYQIGQQENKSQLSNRGQSSSFSVLGRLKVQPTPKTQLIRATPMSEAMEMYNWLYEKKGKYPIHPKDFSLVQKVLKVSSKPEGGIQISQSNMELVAGLWGALQEQNKQDSIPLLPILLVSAHLTVHILNAPPNDLSVGMMDLGISQLQVWQALDLSLNFDKLMPLTLRLHLLTVETSFVTTRLWKNQQLVQVIAQELQQNGHRLFKRIMHQTAFEIHFLCRKMGLQENIEDISYLILQQALRVQEKLLYDRSLQQLVFCSIYAAARVAQFPCKFNELLGVARDILGLSATNYEQLVDRVRIGQSRQNIIIFYNMQFVPALKNFLRILRANSFENSKRLNGPKVRQILSKQSHDFTRVALAASPQMATYLAYNQSPILRPKLKELSLNTVRKQQQQYSLQDIETKFGKFANNSNLKQTRKVKH